MFIDEQDNTIQANQEFKSESEEEFDKILKINSDKLAKKKRINVSNLRVLGQGSYGVAYDIGNGKVLKITKDTSEAKSSNLIKGKNTKHIVKVFDVWKFPKVKNKDDFFGIVLEKLMPLSSGEKREWRNAENEFDKIVQEKDFITRVAGHDWEYFKELADVKVETLYEEDELEEKREELEEAIDRLENFQIHQMVDELKNLGVTFHDYHSGNIMKRSIGEYVVIDLGVSKSAGVVPAVLEKKKKEKDLGFGFNKDGYPLKDKYNFAGFNVCVENPKGDKRYWADNDGKTGITVMQYDYGYIHDTMGPDKDEIDVYVGDEENFDFIFVIHQNKKPKFTEYDEDKVMIGFSSEKEAKQAYLTHYNDDRFYGGMSVIPIDKFKEKYKKNNGIKITNEIYKFVKNTFENKVINEKQDGSIAIVISSFQPFIEDDSNFVRELAQTFNKVILVIDVNHDDKISLSTVQYMIEQSMVDVKDKINIFVSSTPEKPSNNVPLVLKELVASNSVHLEPSTSTNIFVEKWIEPHVEAQFSKEKKSDTLNPEIHTINSIKRRKGDSHKEFIQALKNNNLDKIKNLIDDRISSNDEAFKDVVKKLKKDLTVKENIKDIGGKSGAAEIIKKYSRKLENRLKTDLKNIQPLGTGQMGAAFRLSNNKVLKVTTDASEAKASNRLKGKNLKFVVKIFDVFSFPGELENKVFGIVTELLTPLSSQEKRELETFTSFVRYGGRMELLRSIAQDPWNVFIENYKEELLEEIKEDGVGVPQNSPNYNIRLKKSFNRIWKIHENVLNKFNIKEMVSELQGQNIEFADYHEENLMKKGSQYIINDIGASQTQGAVEPEILENTLLEMDINPDEIIDKNTNKLKRRIGFKADRFVYLDKGSMGYAYKLPNNKVLKVTSDASEAKASNVIKNKDTKFLVKIYDVFAFPDKKSFGILQELLMPLNGNEKNELGRILRELLFMGLLGAEGVYLSWKEIEDKLLKFLNEKDFKYLVEKIKKYNLNDMIDELNKYNIKFLDYHTKNIMKRKTGEYVLLDLGFSKSIGAEPEIIEKLSKIVEKNIKEFMAGASTLNTTNLGNSHMGSRSQASGWSLGKLTKPKKYKELEMDTVE